MLNIWPSSPCCSVQHSSWYSCPEVLQWLKSETCSWKWQARTNTSWSWTSCSHLLLSLVTHEEHLCEDLNVWAEQPGSSHTTAKSSDAVMALPLVPIWSHVYKKEPHGDTPSHLESWKTLGSANAGMSWGWPACKGCPAPRRPPLHWEGVPELNHYNELLSLQLPRRHSPAEEITLGLVISKGIKGHLVKNYSPFFGPRYK